jgi:hypothetical protein
VQQKQQHSRVQDVGFVRIQNVVPEGCRMVLMPNRLPDTDNDHLGATKQQHSRVQDLGFVRIRKFKKCVARLQNGAHAKQVASS